MKNNKYEKIKCASFHARIRRETYTQRMNLGLVGFLVFYCYSYYTSRHFGLGLVGFEFGFEVGFEFGFELGFGFGFGE